MAYYATPYTIHFDDTMAYGSHHFLTGFKFQCAARETLLYGDLIFDQPGVPEALEQIHLFTADAYSRNLSPTFLGDRVTVLITFEEWGKVSTRFCYRVIGQSGQPICAGFQSMIVADAKTGKPVPLPEPLRVAFDAWREITEPEVDGQLYRDRVLKSTDATMKLFTPEIIDSSKRFLNDRYPIPRVIRPVGGATSTQAPSSFQASNSYARTTEPAQQEPARQEPAQPEPAPDTTNAVTQFGLDEGPLNEEPLIEGPETWVFSGQGACDVKLLSQRIQYCESRNGTLRNQLNSAAESSQRLIGGNTNALLSGNVDRAAAAIAQTPELTQIAIHVQGVLGAEIRRETIEPDVLMGHSFGELAALNVSGCYDLETGIRIVCERVKAVREHAPAGGGLLAVMCDRQILREEIAVKGLSNLVIAGRNHNKQTIVSGPCSELEQLRQHLEPLHINSVVVASPTSFHHPALKVAAEAWYRAMKNLPLCPPKIPVYSSIGRRSISAQDDIAAVLCSQLVKPFDLQGAIDDLVSIGCERFIDCGSSGSTSRLIASAGPEQIVVQRPEPSSQLSSQPSSQLSARPSARSSAQAAVATKSANAAPRVTQPSPPLPSAHGEQQSKPASKTRPAIAIVAQGCLLPAGSTTPEKLFDSIVQGRSGIHDKRKLDPYWEQDFYSAKLAPDRSTSGLVGLVNDEDIVKPEGISPELFASFTRAQKLLAIALAPCVDSIKNSNRVLCFMGTTADGFQDQDNFAVMRYSGIDERQENLARRLGDPQSATQDPYAAVREVFDRIVKPDLEIVLVDAACASSLYAVSLGMQALERDEADTVLAGGMFCPGPGNNVLFSQFGGLTATGCRPFDAGADGVVFSEGAAIVVLQRKEDAVRAGKPIHAVVRGAGLSSDGRSPSANVPQTAGQIHALKRCYKNYGIDPQSISAIEAHGTSTPAGDSTEVRTLAQFFKPVTKTSLPIHSLKGLIGHSGWAAGTASIIAATEMLRRGCFPAQATHSSDSNAVTEAEGVLKVLKSSERLPTTNARIAIDGFGFGGSNAHVVVESGESDSETSPLPDENDDDLVVVGVHQSQPTLNENGVLRFDRQALKSLDGIIMLPDLNDDMDITQSLALDAIGNAIKSVEGFNDEFREETGVVLALCGKTERAVEATCRVLSPRLARTLAGLPATDQLNAANEKSRPSGAYTLQCMMPNVSAGRAALQFNLNGPNFVVDSGAQSLEAAFRSGRMLLQNGSESGTRIAVVSAMHANRWPVPGTDAANCKNEFAAAFVLTTRQFAEKNNLPVLCPLQEVSRRIKILDGSTEQKTAAAVAVVMNPPSESVNEQVANATPQRSAAEDFKLHKPIWVESPMDDLRDSETGRKLNQGNWLVFAPAEHDLIANLSSCLAGESGENGCCNNYRILVVGEKAAELANSYGNNVAAFDLSDESTAIRGAAFTEMKPDLLLAFCGEQNWDRFDETLSQVAQNELCEALFVGMKQFVESIRSGQTEVYAVLPGGWQGSIHPNSGAFAGMLKSTKREMPESRLGLISLSSTSVTETIAAMNQERKVEDSSEIEIVRIGLTRLVRRLQVIEQPENSSTAHARSVQLSPESVVVISGGARGVTALMAESLLKNFGCKVVAFGRSALEKGPANYDSDEAERDYYARFITENAGVSPLEMKRSFESARARWEACATIERLANEHGNVEYLPVDVTDEGAVRQAVDQCG